MVRHRRVNLAAGGVAAIGVLLLLVMLPLPAAANSPCTVSPPGPGYTIGGHRYALTSRSYDPGTNFEQAVKSEFGSSAEIADWADLKAAVNSSQDAGKLADALGLESQGKDYGCKNYILIKQGKLFYDSTHYFLIARHDGTRLPDWFVVDQIGKDAIDPGRWNHPGQIVARIPLVSAQPTTTERRVALVIGNSSYKAVSPVPNPSKDAKAVAEVLKRIGFQSVTIAIDLPRDKFVDALHRFAQEADGADWAVIYYAGHGLEVDGINYLIPVDAKLQTDRDVEFETVPLGQVLAAVEGARKLRLVILDACRNNPFAAQMHRSTATCSIGPGLARIEPGGTLVAYAAKDGAVALDGDGANSPFVAALIKNIQQPGVEIGKLFRLVRDDVLRATNGQQEPFVYGSLPGEDFFFVRAASQR